MKKLMLSFIVILTLLCSCVDEYKFTHSVAIILEDDFMEKYPTIDHFTRYVAINPEPDPKNILSFKHPKYSLDVTELTKEEAAETGWIHSIPDAFVDVIYIGYDRNDMIVAYAEHSENFRQNSTGLNETGIFQMQLKSDHIPLIVNINSIPRELERIQYEFSVQAGTTIDPYYTDSAYSYNRIILLELEPSTYEIETKIYNRPKTYTNKKTGINVTGRKENSVFNIYSWEVKEI